MEGADDEHVVRHLCERHPPILDFDIVDKQGFPNLKSAIGPELKVSGRIALGIVVDANDRPDTRLREIGHQLQSADIVLPQQLPSSGAILDSQPRVGVWMMPDNVSAGELEDFIAGLIPVDDPVWPMARRYIDGIPTGDRKFLENKTLRAKIHAWLAARSMPRKMGAAIGAMDLDATAQPARQFVNWLRELFG